MREATHAITHSGGSHIEYGYAGTNMSGNAFTKMKKVFGTIRWGQRSEEDMNDTISLLVHLDFDDEAGVWYVTKSDVPGLSLEAPTATALVERIMQAAPQLIELNEGKLVDCVAAHEVGPQRKPASPRKVAPKRAPHMTVWPVFDRPLELARA